MRFSSGLAAIALMALTSAAPASPAAAIAGNPFAAYEGTYRLASGEWILVSRVGVIEELARPYFLDWKTGRYGYLAAAGPDRFTSPVSPAAKPDDPPQTEIVFGRDAGGTVADLTLRESGAPERRAAREALYRDRPVSFSNGDVTLAGTLRLPSGDGPFPAVVLVHGSGPGERSQLSLMNFYFSSRGMAVLTYHKRGCGASGGDWKKVDLGELADDALAGVRWLRGRPEIDARKVGLWGISQGGWITPLAGSRDDAVAFVMNMSGPATSLRRQDSYNLANTLRFAGYDEEEIGHVMKGMNLMCDYGRGKATAAEVDAFMDAFRPNPRFKDLVFPPTREISIEAMYARQKVGDPAWFFHMDPDNDALAPYRKLGCPALVTYGRLDYSVPVEESVKLLSQVIAERGKKNITVEVIPDSGHGYLRMQEKSPMNPVAPASISRAFFAAVESWLRANGLIRRPPAPM